MLDILTMMASMRLQTEMEAIHKEQGKDTSEPTSQEPSQFDEFMADAASTPLGEAVCQVCSEAAKVMSFEGEGKTADGWFDFASLNLTVPKAPVKSA